MWIHRRPKLKFPWPRVAQSTKKTPNKRSLECWKLLRLCWSVECKRVQQLPTILRVRYPYSPIHLLYIHASTLFILNYLWEKVQNCCMHNKYIYYIRKSYLQCIVRRIQPTIRLWRLYVMCVGGPNNVGGAVQTDPTLLRFASAITEQKKFWDLLAQKFDRFHTLRDNSQQARNNIHRHATWQCANGRNM